MATLPLNTGDFNNCQKLTLLFGASTAGFGLAFSLSSSVGSSNKAVMTNSAAKIARQLAWFSSQAPSSGASAGDSATSGMMVANTRLAWPSR
ncbi:Uncharacterised protein [Acinetobacter baumannii]|nr:Uncharacterised protein [Acinetobacter baumannii]